MVKTCQTTTIPIQGGLTRTSTYTQILLYSCDLRHTPTNTLERNVLLRDYIPRKRTLQYNIIITRIPCKYNYSTYGIRRIIPRR